MFLHVHPHTHCSYKQQKFNLLREESEGYSKLITELTIDRTTPNSSDAVLEIVKSLIGRFSLDPNRVLDIILEAFECHLEDSDFYIRLLRCYPYEKETFLSMFAFKFRFYQNEDSTSAQETPPSLYKMTAVLVREGLVSLEDVFKLLSPSLGVIRKEYGDVMKEARTSARNINKVSLVSNEESEDDKQKQTEPQQFVVKSEEALSSNQKLGLCHALIECGDWENAMSMIDMLPPSFPLLCPPIHKTLCLRIHAIIDPLYRCYMPKAVRSSPLPPPPGVDQCLVYTDLTRSCFELLCRLGPQLHLDPILLVKFLRITRPFVKEYFATLNGNGQVSTEMDAVYSGIVSTLSEAVLPSLSLLPCNCCLAEDIWNVMKALPYDVRYHLYGVWKNEVYDSHPLLIVAKATTLNKAKYIMKRITKDNVKQCGRQLGKLSHSNPGIVFDYVLSQVQSFDNLIVPVVDSLKYLSPLSYDVLSYCVIEALANPMKERLKHEDTTVSQWLQGLATFCGTVYKKYPLELTGLLQFVANQLKGGKSFDLLILKEVVQKMSGIECSEELTQSQVEAMAGGDLLKAEGAYFVQIRNIKKSSSRLKEALIDSDMGLPLALLIGQQRDSIVYGEGEGKHVKLLGMLYDYCMETLVQFQGFLESHLSPEEYARKFPDLGTLQADYHLPHDIVFFFTRPKLQSSIQSTFDSLCKASGASNEKKKGHQHKELYIEAVEVVLKPVVSSVKALQTTRVWEDLSHRMYSTFWSLGLSDLYVPVSRYQEEVAKQKQIIHDTESNPDMSSSKKKKEIERCNLLIQRLREECAAQEEKHKLVSARLHHEKDSWFGSLYKNKMITQFLQLCIFPRCLFSLSDAVYCAKFIQFLHTSRTPNFSTLLFFDRMFADISYTTAMCTENEARRYGRFLALLLEMISRWHQNKDVYDKECSDTPGFIHNVRGGSTDSSKNSLDFDSFRHICFKWHFKVTKALVTCLESKDYQQIRNSLILMTKLIPHYPRVHHLSMALEKRVTNLYEEEKEKRQDLYALAVGYAGMLKSHKSHLIPETEFHNKDERVKAAEQQRQSESHTSSKGNPQLAEPGKEEDRNKSSGSRHAKKSPLTARKSPQPPRKSPQPPRVSDEGKSSRSGKEGRSSHRDSPKEEQGGRSSREGSKAASKSETKSETKPSKGLSESRSSSKSKTEGRTSGKGEEEEWSKERSSNHPGGMSKGNSTPLSEEHSDKKGRDPTPSKRRNTPTPEHDASDSKRRKLEEQKVKEDKPSSKRESALDGEVGADAKRKKLSPSRDVEHKRRSGKSQEEGTTKSQSLKKPSRDEDRQRISKSSKK
jgi:THO complex subunit 2